ncbi:MAG: hypothetical protein ACYTE3_12655 [Planctomycetota bacterium]|jgi:hypothetical protein
MCKRKQELQDLIKKDRQHNDNTMVAMKEQLDSCCGRQYSGDVVITAFREIEKVFQADGRRVWIHVKAGRTWLTVGYGAKVSGKKEYEKQLKYQVEVSGKTMKSRLCQMRSAELQKEYPIGDEHEIAGDAGGKAIADITSKDIIDDFIAAFEGYANKKPKS